MYWELIKLLLVTPLAADFIADRSGVMERFKFWLFYKMYSKRTRFRPYRIKPFDCSMCLSFWLCLIQINNVHNILLPFAAATVGAIISRL